MKARKRDGRLDLFDPTKIAVAIHKAAQSVGHGESLLAEELASVVTLLLEKDFSDGVVPIQEIQETVEKVLMETGHTEIAKSFLLYRERREKIKEVIQVREEADFLDIDYRELGEVPDTGLSGNSGISGETEIQGPGRSDLGKPSTRRSTTWSTRDGNSRSGNSRAGSSRGGNSRGRAAGSGEARDGKHDGSKDSSKEVHVNGSIAGSIAPWSKGRIIKALVTEAELPADMAAEIASEVEAKVFKSGLTRISSTLIRELVDNELFNRGLNRRLLNQSILGIPGFDLRRIVESEDEGKTSADVDCRVSGRVLRQFSLRWIHSPEEAEVHLRGDARLLGLTHPSGYVDLDLEPALLPTPFGGPSATPRYLAPCIRYLGRFVARYVHVNITDAVLHAYTARGISPEQYAEELLSMLAEGPVGSVESGRAPLPGTPIIRISRRLTERRKAVLKAANMERRAAEHFMEVQVTAFLDAAVKLSRELSIPHLELDLGGPSHMDDGILTKAILLDAAGRLTLSLRTDVAPPRAAITPVKGAASLDFATLLQRLHRISEAGIKDEARSVMAMAAAALFSKDQYMRKLHRKSRGPETAIRRYLGGDSDTLGPGIFVYAPSFLMRLEAARNKNFEQENNRLSGLDRFTAEVAGQLKGWIVEEAQKSGHRFNLVAPWAGHSYERLYQRTDNVDLAYQKTRAWYAYVPLDPIPDCFRNEAEKRMTYIRMIMEGLAERENVS